MANETTANVATNLNNYSPTGAVTIVSGVTNVSSLAAGANQQINVGDPIVQFNDANNNFAAGNNAWLGIPAQCLKQNGNGGGGGANGNANNNIAMTVAVQALQAAVHNNFAGLSVGYRSAKNSSAGKPSDVISVAGGRCKLPVDANSNNGGFNAAGSGPAFNAAAATPVGTPWGVSCVQNNVSANNVTAAVSGLYVPCGNVGNQTGANYAIGRQALPKQINDPYVWIDVVPTLLTGGPVEIT